MPAQPALRFVLAETAVSPDEQRALGRDIERHDLDDRYWIAMNGLLSTRSRSDTPLVLRAYRGGRFAGLAHIMECRRTNQCFFPGRLGRLLDFVPMPMYYWARGDAAVDLLANPGFITHGEDAEQFHREAIAFLNRRYLVGCVMDERGTLAAAGCHETPIMDWGRYGVRPGGVEALLDAHKHLRRKLNRFRNKGGTLQTVTGPLAAEDREAVLHCLRQSATLALLRTPFQENYANMVRWATTADARGLVHILARLEGAVVGYHTFLHTGRRLQCLSGGFDRSRHSTYHAYENILIEAMRYAEDHRLRHVAFGPVGNASKASVMPEFAPFVLRFYSRLAVVRRAIAAAVPRSALRPEALVSCSGLQARPLNGLRDPIEPAPGGAVPADEAGGAMSV